MANVEDLLRKQKDRIEKIGASPASRKKITRTGPTRPWQENLPQYQTNDAEQTAKRPSSTGGSIEPALVSKDSQELPPIKLTATQSTESRSTNPGSRDALISVSELTSEFTEIQPTEFRSTEIESTETLSTERQSTKIQLTQIQSTKPESTKLRSSKERVGESFEPVTRSSGYFQLNYSSLELMRKLDPGEFVVFQFLTLKAWGWNQDKHCLGSGLVRAAGTYVSLSLGIAKSSADKYLGSLVDRGLLALVEKSHKHGNSYRVEPVLTMNGQLPESRSTENQETSRPPTSQLVDRQMVTSSPRSGQLVDRDSVTLVDSKKENRKSLSHESPASWGAFTAQLTEKARERADRVFESLKKRFPADSVDELAACPKNLERFGAPDGTPWEKINSPVGLMESSWPQLRDFFRKKGEEARKAEANRYSAEESRKLREKIDRELAEEQQRRRDAFLTAFPDEDRRREVVQKYLGDLPFKPDGMIGQGIAIGKWWDENGTLDHRTSEE
jgi:hypothetical protein